LLSDILVLPLPKFADLPAVDLEKYDQREIGNIDAAGHRFDPVLRDVCMNGTSVPGGGIGMEMPHLFWAPDSSRFAYATTGRRAAGDIFTYNPATKALDNLTERMALPERTKGNGYVASHYLRVNNSPKFGDIYPPLWLADGQGLIGVSRGEACIFRSISRSRRGSSPRMCRWKHSGWCRMLAGASPGRLGRSDHRGGPGCHHAAG